MKNLMNKLAKILLVVFMIFSSTMQVHAEPRDGIGGGDNQWSEGYYPDSAYITYDKDSSVYTITSMNDLSQYNLSNVKLTLDGSSYYYVDLDLRQRLRDGGGNESSEYVYTFTTDSIKDIPEGINGGYYNVYLDFVGLNYYDIYQLTRENRVWFEKNSIAFDNNLINKGEL